MNRRVTVLMGGWSSEREVSLVSGAACAAALAAAGDHVTRLDVPRDPGAFLEALRDTRPDVAFNALHGRWGEDGRIQAVLDLLAIPYTHSGVLASALAMDKPIAKRLFAEAGIPVADHHVVTRDQVVRGGPPMARPYVIKPLNEGSSVGVHVVREGDNRDPLTEPFWPYGDGAAVMVERFVPGRELTVAVMGERPLAVTEITTHRGFYDYEAKYAAGGSAHALPAPIPEQVAEEVETLAVLAHRVLGCRGVTRSDFRWDGTRLVILEVNTQPGMTPTSLVPEQAAHVGIGFTDLVSWMVDHAECDA